MLYVRLAVLLGLIAVTSVGCFRMNAVGDVELTEFGAAYADNLASHHSTTCTTWCGKHRCTSRCSSY